MSTMVKRLYLPRDGEEIRHLRVGQAVLLYGNLYTARDAAHRRLVQDLEAGRELPLPLAGQLLYYCGPCPPPPGWASGSAGPTTSSRMDGYLEPLLAQGLRGTVGKGPRSPEAMEVLVRYGAVYLLATGGAGARLAGCIKSSKVIAFPELGPEAIRALEVQAFPVLVAGDARGGDLFHLGPAGFQQRKTGPEIE